MQIKKTKKNLRILEEHFKFGKTYFENLKKKFPPFEKGTKYSDLTRELLK